MKNNFYKFPSLRGKLQLDEAIQLSGSPRSLHSLAMTNRKKKGFTLVELSIVLVIIGLLIGGILVGQSLIQSAELNKEVRRLSQYAIAVVQFKQKFKQEAGDTTIFSYPGNNDGDNVDTIGACPTYTSENETAWSHLTQSGMLTGETFVWTTNPTSVCISGYVGSVPTNKIAADGSIRPFLYLQSKFGIDFGGKMYQRSFYVIYNPEIIWGLENKLDDGVPSSSTGKISSLTYGGGYDCDPAGVEQEPEQSKFCDFTIHFNDSLN